MGLKDILHEIASRVGTHSETADANLHEAIDALDTESVDPKETSTTTEPVSTPAPTSDSPEASIPVSNESENAETGEQTSPLAGE